LKCKLQRECRDHISGQLKQGGALNVFHSRPLNKNVSVKRRNRNIHQHLPKFSGTRRDYSTD